MSAFKSDSLAAPHEIEKKARFSGHCPVPFSPPPSPPKIGRMRRIGLLPCIRPGCGLFASRGEKVDRYA